LRKYIWLLILFLFFISKNAYAEGDFLIFQQETGVFVRDGHLISPCSDIGEIFMVSCTTDIDEGLLQSNFFLNDVRNGIKKMAKMRITIEMSKAMNEKYDRDWGVDSYTRKEEQGYKKTTLRHHTTALCLAMKSKLKRFCDAGVGINIIKFIYKDFVEADIKQKRKDALIERKKAQKLRAMKFRSECQKEALVIANIPYKPFQLEDCITRKELKFHTEKNKPLVFTK